MNKLILSLIILSASVLAQSGCPEGSITASCLCGGKEYSQGFCCEGVFFDDVFFSSCPASIFFVDGAAGSDSYDGATISTAKKTIRAGIALLREGMGDALVIRSGDYSGDTNKIINVPNGAPGRYTIIKAENDWGVTLRGTSYYAIDLRDDSYLHIQGIHVRDTSPVYIEGCNHIKVIRISSNQGNFVVYGGERTNLPSTNILYEECFAYGSGRYRFQATYAYGGANHIVYRRNLCRYDYATQSPYACFADYQQNFVAYQNNIAIDGTDYRVPGMTYVGLKGFVDPNGGKNVYYSGNLVLNLEGTGFSNEQTTYNFTYMDNIVWDLKDNGQAAEDAYDAWFYFIEDSIGPIKMDHMTFGESRDLGAGITGESQYLSTPDDYLKNSIIYGVFLKDGNYANQFNWDLEDYNAYFDNTGGRDYSRSLGAHSVTDKDPISNGLRYLPRIEDGSFLAGAGEGGGRIGAEVVKKIGVPGTLWGEPGWNETTGESLWPFPNEDIMKEEVASFYKAPGQAYANSPEMIGSRGFAEEGLGLYGGPITLTSYIWEYLGNPCPAEICDKAAPVCGNSICDSGETCGSCPADCHSVHAADTSPCDGCLSDTELLAEISRWKAGSSAMQSLLSAISAWKTSC